MALAIGLQAGDSFIDEMDIIGPERATEMDPLRPFGDGIDADIVSAWMDESLEFAGQIIDLTGIGADQKDGILQVQSRALAQLIDAGEPPRIADVISDEIGGLGFHSGSRQRWCMSRSRQWAMGDSSMAA